MIYNLVVKKHFGLQNTSILLLLLALILGPRVISGFLALDSAQYLDSSGFHEQAAQAYSEAAARLPWNPKLWEHAGIQALLADDPGSAILYLEKADLQEALSKQGWLNLGLAHEQLGDIPAAMRAWNQALPLAEAYRRLAQAEQNAGNFPQAIENWQYSIAGEADNANAHYQLGLLLAATNPALAAPELLLADQLDPTLDATVQVLRTALNTGLLSKNRAYQFVVVGQGLASLGQWNLAKEAFQNAVLMDEDYAEAWAWLGQTKQHLGLDGSQEFSQALTLGPEFPIVQGLYGLSQQELGKPEEAIAAYQKAADMEPENPGWQLALGSAYEQKGDLISAYSYYVQALELAPEDPSTWRAIASFSVINDVDVEGTGLPAVKKLIELDPNNWQSYDLAGQAAFMLEDYAGAEEYLKKAVDLAPSQAAPALHLGLVYIQMDDLSLAVSYLSVAKTFDPTGPYGWQAGRLLEQMVP